MGFRFVVKLLNYQNNKSRIVIKFAVCKLRKDIRAVSKDLLREFLLPKETKLSWNQVYEWLWSKGAHSFEDMTNIRNTYDVRKQLCHQSH
jgi:adenine C2-methylase RlmN of 23S rRNA A2503 and tRNA A37